MGTEVVVPGVANLAAIVALGVFLWRVFGKRLDVIDVRLDKVDGNFEKMDAKADARFAEVDGKFEKMEEKLDARSLRSPGSSRRWMPKPTPVC